MSRGLDHVVHAVRDLDAAADMYRRLGFTVGARNAHPWGTHNRIVQFSGFFIELLTVAEPEKIPPPEPHVFSFGAFQREFLARGEGFSGLVLESGGAAQDAEGFRAAGIGAFDPFHFEREARSPDGSRVTVGFSLAFAADPKAPDISFFTCEQHHPENFWNPQFQRHANTASEIAGAVLVAKNPTDHHIFLSVFVGERDLQVSSGGMTVRTPRGAIQVRNPAGFSNDYGIEPPDVSRGARLAAIRLRVGDGAMLRELLGRGGIEAAEQAGGLIVGPVRGAVLIFEPGGSRR
jgi:catechol 2,3-dioxygenase-like lactoylglutathione lyase family enzyme